MDHLPDPRLRSGVSRSPGFFSVFTLALLLWAPGACTVGTEAPDGLGGENGDPVPTGPATGYYDSVDTSDPDSLRQTLHEVIDDHEWHYYTHSWRKDTWDILEHAQEDPEDPDRVIDVYRNASFNRWNAGNSDYDREHTWPKSLGFPRNIKYNYPYTDAHHLMLADGDYNSERGNKPYGTCTQPCEEWVTVENGDHEGSSDEAPENSNWTRGFNLNGVWEVWQGRRGDVARAMFYMDVRYEGGLHGVSNRSEPDLILTDDLSLLVSDTQTNRSVGYMGHLSTLVQWHLDDPVSEEERLRNNVIQSHQGNRNPFIDHPEWALCLYTGECGERPAVTTLWINEIHYDNASADAGEGIEIAGAAGTSLDGYTLVAYNGSSGAMYKTVDLEGFLISTSGGGALWFDIPGLQNGGPDGIALVDPTGEVLQLLSYEGTFTAADGPASGLMFTDIGVVETGSTPLDTSLQLVGSGCAPGDFTWTAGKAQTRDAANDGQTLTCQ